MWTCTLGKRKIQSMPGDLFKFWANLMMLAAKNDRDGMLPSLEDIDYELRTESSVTISMTDELVRRELLDRLKSGLRIHDWEEWQVRGYSSRDRTRAWRERKRDADVTISDVTVTSQATEDVTKSDVAELEKRREEKEKEKKKTRVAKPPEPPFDPPDWVPRTEWDELVAIRKKKRAINTPHALALVVRELEKLRAAGDDPKLVLEQAIRRSYTDVWPLSQTDARPSKNGRNSTYSQGMPGQKSTTGQPPPETEADRQRVAANMERQRRIKAEYDERVRADRIRGTNKTGTGEQEVPGMPR